MITLTTETFDKEIKAGAMLIDFWAEWCGPCRALSPIVEQLSEEMKGLRFGKVNVDENPELAEKFRVVSIPTLLLVKNGRVIANRVGASSKESIREWINSSIKA